MGTRERHLSFIETYFVGNDGLTQMAGGWHCRTDGKQLFQHLCHHCKRSLGFAQQLSILGYNSRAKTISALQEVPAVIKIYWPILRFRMKYFKGKQSLTEQRITEHSPFLNTNDFLLTEIQSLAYRQISHGNFQHLQSLFHLGTTHPAAFHWGSQEEWHRNYPHTYGFVFCIEMLGFKSH